MFPVQEIIIKTKEDRRFNIYIEKPENDIFTWRLYFLDLKFKISDGSESKATHHDSVGAFEEALALVIDYVNKRKEDAIEFIDNPCNCELIDAKTQKNLVSKRKQSYPVKINGQIQ